MAVLANGQYELSYDGYSLVFGRGTPITVRELDLGSAANSTNDYQSPRADGIGFGRDYKGGRLLAWSGNILARATSAQKAAGITSQRLALDALGVAEAHWDAPSVRLEPERVAVLRARRGGVTRRVYGRPRDFAPRTGNTYQGWIPYEATFQARDHLYYDDLEQQVTVGMVPDGVGGLEGDRVGPWDAVALGAGQERVEVNGTKPSWLNFRVNGPVSGALVDPIIEVVGQWRFQLKGEIRYDEFVSVISNPWERTIRRSDGANWAGNITTLSQRPSGMLVPPGAHTVLVKGTDSTLTSSVKVFWRDTFGSHA